MLNLTEITDDDLVVNDINIGSIINLMAGTYYLNDTLLLNNSFLDNYLTIQSFNGEEVIISGGKELEFQDGTEWTAHSYQEIEWKQYDNYNNVYGASGAGDRRRYLGEFNTRKRCCNQRFD